MCLQQIPDRLRVVLLLYRGKYSNATDEYRL